MVRHAVITFEVQVCSKCSSVLNFIYIINLIGAKQSNMVVLYFEVFHQPFFPSRDKISMTIGYQATKGLTTDQ